jgi:adenylate cyclase
MTKAIDPAQLAAAHHAEGVAPSSLDVRLARAASRAGLMQDLLTPVDGIIELAEMLLHDANEREQMDLVRDLQKIHDAGERLRGLFRRLIETPAELADGDDGERRLRHDLVNCLNPIIGYAEELLEDAPAALLEAFVPDLEKILSLGKQIAVGLDKLMAAATAAAEPVVAVAAGDWTLRFHGTEERREPVPTGVVLVVDDNDTNRDLLVRWLHRDGHQIVEARNGREALAVLRERRFDLVLLDVLMPEVNGFEVLERMKADPALRHLPVVMISAFNEIDSVAHCIERGADDYLPKPFKPVLLRARVNACLEKKRLLEQIEAERRRADELLHVILPAPVVTELKANNRVRPCRHENVAVLFCDIAGFTPYCDRNCPEDFFPVLQKLVEAWEESALRHGVEKIKTIGDAFMAAAGLLRRDVANPVRACVALGQEMIRLTRELTPWNIRVGIHAGPVVAGVIGRRQYLFDLWGDTVNTAARMESHGVVGSVVLSADAWRQIASIARAEPRGPIQVKGKGVLETYRFEAFHEG